MAQHHHHKTGSLDDAAKTAVGDRLRRIEGQVRGLQRMVDEDRYCPEVLIQISAVQESLRKVAQVMLRSHLSHCVTGAVKSGNAKEAEAIYDELADLFNKYAR